MNEKSFPPMYGDKVTVNIPKGLPELMMNVTREVLRDPPQQECEAFSLVADYLDKLLMIKIGEDNLMTMITNLNKTDEERYIEKLKGSGYTIEQLDEFARIIQQGWKRYVSRIPERHVPEVSKTDDRSWTNEMVTDELIKTVESYGISLESANKSATIIQKTWRKYSKLLPIETIISSTSVIDSIVSAKQSNVNSLDELDFENDSDDMERVNVVKKGQRDYVPPIPDFIDDGMDLLKELSMTNTMERLREMSYAYNDEAADENSIN